MANKVPVFSNVKTGFYIPRASEAQPVRENDRRRPPDPHLPIERTVAFLIEGVRLS